MNSPEGVGELPQNTHFSTKTTILSATRIKNSVSPGVFDPEISLIAVKSGGKKGVRIMNIHSHDHFQKPAGNSMIPANEHPVPAPVPATGSGNTSDITLPVLRNAIMRVEESLVDFQDLLDMTTNMTGRERQRLISARTRNYGFIMKAFVIALENPAFRPGNFSFDGMTENVEILDQARQLTLVLEQLRAFADDLLLMACDTSYRDALRVYGNLREQNRSNVAGARALFKELLQYFTLHRGGRAGDDELSEKELEADFHRLIHGRADGEMVIKNEMPHKTGGAHEIVDDVHKPGKHDGAEIKVKEEE